MTEFNPDWASPPGDTITDILEERKKTSLDLARACAWTVDFTQALIRGDVPITPQLANDLEMAFGVGAQFWLNRQANYDAVRKRLGLG